MFLKKISFTLNFFHHYLKFHLHNFAESFQWQNFSLLFSHVIGRETLHARCSHHHAGMYQFPISVTSSNLLAVPRHYKRIRERQKKMKFNSSENIWFGSWRCFGDEQTKLIYIIFFLLSAIRFTMKILIPSINKRMFSMKLV